MHAYLYSAGKEDQPWSNTRGYDHHIADNAYTKLIVPGFEALVMTLRCMDFLEEAVILWLNVVD